ncbi:MAG: hypothetical protein M3174_00245 [Actinomycetota bacterium]|nr:hypothetical protein [Actinomycetota bacterium]
MQRRLFAVAILTVIGLLGSAAPAGAHHTNPREPVTPLEDPGTTTLLTEGDGRWRHIRNFPPNPGSDIKFFRKKGRLFAVSGSLGQGDMSQAGDEFGPLSGVAVGQRFIRLINKKGNIRPRWVADHGSAACEPTPGTASSTTSLQHDQIVTPKRNPRLMIDTTDAAGRCHDPGGGGLEIVDISRIHKKKFKPREIHLTRHSGTSHTVTLDAKRPWIVYNNSSQSSGMSWIDVLNIKSCLNQKLRGLKAKIRECRPKVFRIYLRPEWSQRIDANGDRVEGSESSCHDITSRGNRIYCANLNSTVVLNVRRLTRPNGAIRGEPLKCDIVKGTDTDAKVTDCDDLEAVGNGQARGWKYVGHINHPGRNASHNTNHEYESTEGVAVSHEAEPTPNKRFMFVTDERGGGIVPIGASCPGTPNPYGNGGVHVIKIGRGGEYKYAKTPEGDKAVFIGSVQVPSTTFCTAHVMEQFKREQRFSIAWYSQGTKVVDWFTNADNRWTFRETAAVVPQNPSANTWTSLVFHVKKRPNGKRTYYFMASDITRGIDIMAWTGRPNKFGTRPPKPEAAPVSATDSDESTSQKAIAFGFLAAAFLAPATRRRRRPS